MDEMNRANAVSLFTFLKEYARLSRKPIRSLDSDAYREILWFGNVPKEPECSCSVWKGQNGEDGKPLSVPSEGWLEIRRPDRSEPPEPPEDVVPWIKTDLWVDSQNELPELYETILNPDWESGIDDDEKIPQFLNLPDFPEIQKTWDQYIEDEWWRWAENDRKKEKVQDCYNQLFRLHRAKLQMGDDYELILSVGCLSWIDPKEKSEKIKRHVLTLAATVRFDSINAVVTVQADGSMSDVHLETDMLLLNQQPDQITDLLLKERKLELGTDILCDRAKELLKSMAHGLPSGDGKFIDTLDEVPAFSTNSPVIYFSPALILRRRSARTLISFCEQIEMNLSDNLQTLPSAVRTVIGEQGVNDGIEGPNKEIEKRGKYNESREVYFPLAANNEQKMIIERLESQTGVLVQGPPGTGKSQTIANLICHLLANGKKILITSQKTPALRVLKEKLPASVADLCVLLLGEGNDQQTALQKSVSEITTRYNSFDKSDSDRKIQSLQKRLEKLRNQEAKSFETLCALRSREEEEFPLRFESYMGKLGDIAKKIFSEKDEFAWFKDHLPSGCSLLSGELPKCPISANEAIAALFLMKSISPTDEERAKLVVPKIDELPPPQKVETMVAQEMENLKEFEENKFHLNHPACMVLMEHSPEDLSQIADQLHEITSLKSAISGKSLGWENFAVQQILAGERVVWEELKSASETLLKKIRNRLTEAANYDVNGMKGRSTRAVLKDAQELYDHFCRGGKIGFWISKPPIIKRAGYLLKEVTIDGRQCKTKESLECLIQWLELQEAMRGLEEQWKIHTTINVTNMPLNQAAGRFEQEYKRLIAIMSLGDKTDALSKTLMVWDPAIVPVWEQPESVVALEILAKAIILKKSLSDIANWFSVEKKKLTSVAKQTTTAPESIKALRSLENRSAEEYREAYNEIQRLNKLKNAITGRDQRVSDFKSKLPKLASTIINSMNNTDWEKLLRNIELAWNWKCADAWLLEVSDPGAERKLQKTIKTIRERISDTQANLAAELAWKHCIKKMGDIHYANLIAWKNAIAKLGKGTGKYAERNREIARERLEQCRGAVPAWVMPIHRILDTVKPSPEIFDVVIIDEASQSGPEALFLSYLAKQIVVVGDDKQIRPETVGLDQNQVHQLQKRYLKDIPHPEIYDPTESIFGIATVRFGNPVRLREHFRCMPEIIGFSNRLCYQDQPLIPLRQFGGNRLEPVLKTTYVSTGFQDSGKGKINKNEAELLVESIEQCCEDPKYNKKSIGVISLLNTSDQDRYIEQLIVSRLDPEEIINRNIICGDAYDFQGDERDIIFLSTVSARSEGRRPRALTDQKAERRFNVAASRAKDQLWLFHSINVGELGQNCLRRRLLTYMNEPKVDPLGGTISMSLAELHELSEIAQRSVDFPPHPFDSWFEVDVYLAIADRQYVVVPQYEVRGYRIDLVIIGGARKLAVECDGDRWHGPEEYEKDLRRQYDLERCGWEFFRVRGSTFYHNPRKALDELWKLLSHKDFGVSSLHDEEGEKANNQEGKISAYEKDSNEKVESKDHEQKDTSVSKGQKKQSKATGLNNRTELRKERTTIPKRIKSAEDLIKLKNRALCETIILILDVRPNNSCKKETMTSLVCSFYGVITRGKPRIKVQRKVNSAIRHLIKRKILREYKAKNVRIQLLRAGKAWLAKHAQMNIPFEIANSTDSARFENSTSQNNSLLLKAVELLKREQKPLSRSEIINALQIQNSDWKFLMRDLVSHKQILRTGERLSTRYEYTE